jgi:hypothetical protein
LGDPGLQLVERRVPVVKHHAHRLTARVRVAKDEVEFALAVGLEEPSSSGERPRIRRTRRHLPKLPNPWRNAQGYLERSRHVSYRKTVAEAPRVMSRAETGQCTRLAHGQTLGLARASHSHESRKTSGRVLLDALLSRNADRRSPRRAGKRMSNVGECWCLSLDEAPASAKVGRWRDCCCPGVHSSLAPAVPEGMSKRVAILAEELPLPSGYVWDSDELGTRPDPQCARKLEVLIE